ncbi:MAG TPA: metallophosphoesterase [Acidimicrobiales bacterium]|nr:metallophosphoesterase [Acidimicrobiales bacterium]
MDPIATAITTSTAAAVIVEDDAAVVVAAGDIACEPGRPPSTGQCQQEATAKTVESLRPDAVLALGDLQYERGEKANFEGSYAKSWGRFKRVTHPAPGNHEWSTPNLAGYRNYWPGKVDAAKRKTWYSFDLGDWHVVALDSNCRSVGGCESGSPQEQWLRADLAAHRAKCTLAFWHHPRWSSGYHGSDRGYDAFWQALADAGADVVLGGHDHHYERFGADRGIRQFVVGTGGRSLYPTITVEARSEVRNSTTFGVLALRLGKNAYSWRFVPSVGGFIDEGTARC